MKLNLFTAILLTASVTACGGGNRTNTEKQGYGGACISFTDSLCDMGTVTGENPTKEHRFEFVNTGNVPAVILSVNASCRCTDCEYTRNVIRPGEKGWVLVKFDGTKASVGYFAKSVTVRFNSPRQYLLQIKGRLE